MVTYSPTSGELHTSCDKYHTQSKAVYLLSIVGNDYTKLISQKNVNRSTSSEFTRSILSKSPDSNKQSSNQH